MNTNKFTFSRYASFFRWFAAVSMKNSLLTLSVIAAVAIVAGLVSSWSHFDSDGRIYAIILFVAVGVAASLVLSPIDKQTVRQQFISIPASHWEKFLAIFTLQIIMQALIVGIIAAADGIWAKSPGLFTFLEPFTLIGYWALNYFAGTTLRKIPFIYGMIVGGTMYLALIKNIKALLGGDDNVLLGFDGFGSKIFTTILIVAILFLSYYCFKKIRYNTWFYQHSNTGEL